MKRTKATPVLDWFRKTAVDIENDEVRQFKANGGKVVGCLDPDTPLEILEAAGEKASIIGKVTDKEGVNIILK